MRATVMMLEGTHLYGSAGTRVPTTRRQAVSTLLNVGTLMVQRREAVGGFTLIFAPPSTAHCPRVYNPYSYLFLSLNRLHSSNTPHLFLELYNIQSFIDLEILTHPINFFESVRSIRLRKKTNNNFYGDHQDDGEWEQK